MQMIQSAISDASRKTLVVIGNGMVGHRFCEQMAERDTLGQFRIVTFCEEPRPAYDRVGLSKYFATRSADSLALTSAAWYAEQGIELHIGDRVTAIDRDRKVVRSQHGREVPYDYVVLASGSAPFVPNVPGVDKNGVFVYRTIEDLDKMIGFASRAKSAAVIGGGLLGLEAAKAVCDLGLKAHVVEFAPRLMPRQLDDRGARVLTDKIEALGVRVHLGKSTREIQGNGHVEGLAFTDDTVLPAEMIVISAGIRPRDELARQSGLTVGPRGGVLVDEQLRTSDPCIFAIGEVALFREMIYGLVAPGYQMAEVLAANFTGGTATFAGADLSTKLKLMGVDVASFGQYDADPAKSRALTYEDPVTGIYKKLVVTLDGTRLLGGMLVGDASDFGRLTAICRAGEPLKGPASELLLGSTSASAATACGSSRDEQICSCNNVARGAICDLIRDKQLTTLGDVKKASRAGTGCGGCLPQVADILKGELKRAGRDVDRSLCEHFPHSRQDLFQIAKVKEIRTFEQLIREHGSGDGCEICKPAVASILASLWNENVLDGDRATLQDTNDRFLANIQRGGVYSVVPRVAGGEITPEKLIALGTVARKYGLYTKITGGQRVDLFGAPVHQLPAIWEELVAAGFESGHAYGKALRTVKSCVGSTWCRYGVGDSVGFAIRIENRYKGLRSPHKLKSGVSGCVRECAEAQGKDFGLIATEKGYNLYVCGNGGAKPRHADLLASDLDEETCIKYLDRFLMYYVMTADRLTRTSVWLDNLEGGIEFLKQVVIEDRLGICDELEAMMQRVVDTYRCEWKEVVDDPVKRAFFRQFVNVSETEPDIEFVTERGQQRPADWVTDEQRQLVTIGSVSAGGSYDESAAASSWNQDEAPAASDPTRSWVRVGATKDFPRDGGATIRYGYAQIAVFHFFSRGEWYATQNMCPHQREFVLSRGILGDARGEPKVACPLHKKSFSLKNGACLTGEEYHIATFPVKVVGDDVFLHLPPPGALADRPAVAQRSCGTPCGDGCGPLVELSSSVS